MFNPKLPAQTPNATCKRTLMFFVHAVSTGRCNATSLVLIARE